VHVQTFVVYCVMRAFVVRRSNDIWDQWSQGETINHLDGRFVSSKYISTVDTLSAAVEEGEQRKNVQEYLEIRNRPANGINYAWCVLAKLLGIAPGNIDNTVFGSFRLIDGGAEDERALKVFDEEDFKMLRSLEVLETLYRPKTSLVGKDLSAVRKRNVIKMILEGGLGLTIQMARFSHGARKGSHMVVPMPNWKALDDRYGGLKKNLEENRRNRFTCRVEVDECSNSRPEIF
jgi:hypothetical protein